MNINIPFSWIKDFLKTDADIETIVKLVTATGPTVEEIKKVDDDWTLNIEITVNRPDCLSILGIAREIYAALLQNGIPTKLENDYLSQPARVDLNTKDIPLEFQIDPRLTPRFTAVLLNDVKIGPAPDFVKKRLEKSGIRSLNNAIDITNYLMLELGQPNHAFDFNKIAGPKFIVRPAKKGESIVTLDGNVHKLEAGDNIIADGSGKIIDLCGIMGGQASCVDNNTKQILFTVPNDYFASIRKTAMRLGTWTEAAVRLSKELNPEVVYPTMLRGIQLFVEHTNAKVSSQIVDIYPKKQEIPTIFVTQEFLDNKIGLSIENGKKILESLGFKVKQKQTGLEVAPPIWRINDIQIPEDIAEEIARVNNYDNIPNQPLTFEIPEKPKDRQKIFKLEKKISDLLTAWGFTETISYSMLSQAEVNNSAIKIINPLSSEWEYMQTSLIPNLIKNAEQNLHQEDRVMIFEIANVFDKQGKENRRLGMATTGPDCSPNKLKGFVQQLLKAVKSDSQDYRDFSGEGIKSTPSDIYTIEIDLEKLLQKISDCPPKYQPGSKYTPIIEDWTLIKPHNVFYDQIENTIKQNPCIGGVKYLNNYQNRVSIRVYYQLLDKQITDKDVKAVRKEILTKLSENLNVAMIG